MKKRIFCAVLAAALLLIFSSCAEKNEPEPETSAPIQEAELEAEPVLSEEREQLPEDNGVFVLTFAGDCTLGSEFASYNSEWSFNRFVGNDYGYPLSGAQSFFEDDDFTIVNLEGALTDYDTPEDKTFRFRGPPEYTQILISGSVECVSLANNHSGDYGKTGLADTKAALEAAGILYVSDGGSFIYELPRGLKLGVCAEFTAHDNTSANIRSLRENGADIVIAVFHFGIEGQYDVTENQKTRAHNAVDCGADIVFGQHPHVLQKIEHYNGGVIYYSLGNFSFGGNRNPADSDTAIIRQYIIRNDDGSFYLGDTEPVPFCTSSSDGRNDFRPAPYEKNGEGWQRVMEKLAGNVHGSALKS